MRKKKHLLQPKTQDNPFTPVFIGLELCVKGNSLSKSFCVSPKSSKCLSFSFFVLLRVQDLQLYHPQLQHYKQTSTSLSGWIDATRKKQDALQATKIDNIQALREHINNQKVSCSALHCCLQRWVSMSMCVKSSDIWHLYIIVFSRPWTQKS